MNNKSSTLLALTSILGILAVLSIIINNSESFIPRKPFAAKGMNTAFQTGDIEETGSTSNKIGLEKAETKTVQVTLSNPLSKAELETNADQLNNLESTAGGNGQKIDELGRITNEALREAGFKSFVIKVKPFSGKLFNQFDLKAINSLNIIEKEINILDRGQKNLALNVYEFQLNNSVSAGEVFDYIKANTQQELGIEINQNNQFGMASFYINLPEVQKYAFLVVKTRDNVYALSYPKDVSEASSQDFYKLTSKLLGNLI